MNKVTRQERGWAGHFILADRCRFTRNTLLTYDNITIIISTVGNVVENNRSVTIDSERYYETMAFYSCYDKYNDIDVSREVYFESKWRLAKLDDIAANNMHEDVVDEIATRMRSNIDEFTR